MGQVGFEARVPKAGEVHQGPSSSMDPQGGQVVSVGLRRCLPLHLQIERECCPSH